MSGWHLQASYSFKITPPSRPKGVVAERKADDPLVMREKILTLQAELQAAIERGDLIENTDDLPLRHSFIPGGYAREMTIPADTLIVGKIHRHPCFNFVTEGRMTVLTEDGTKEIVAPACFTSAAGVKRVGYAHETVVWTTVHITEETDLDRLEQQLTAPDFHSLAAPRQEGHAP